MREGDVALGKQRRGDVGVIRMIGEPRHSPPVLVLLPGMDGTGAFFHEFCQALDPRIKTVVISYPSDRDMGYAELEAFVRSLLPQNEAFILLGESFSGPLAITIAASPPPGLRGLILVCSFARHPLAVLAPLRSLIRFLPIHAVPTSLFGSLTFGRFKTQHQQTALAKSIASLPPSIIKSRIKSVLEIDTSAFLARIAVPALYLRATRDRLVPRSASTALAAIPDIRFAEVEAPHFLLQAKPSVAAMHILDFLQEIGEL